MMGWYSGGLGWGAWLLMAAAMVAFWGLVAYVIIAIFQGARRSAPPQDRPDPIRVLDERFARGEIDEAEYQARRNVLRSSAH